MGNELRHASERLASDMVEWRRHLHAHPELSQREEQTAAFIVKLLREMGYSPQERVGDTHGVVVDIPGSDPQVIALRADIDALPVAEENDVAYASRNPGVMHACGHDAHTAMLLGAARLLREREGALPHGVRLIFQPSEELYPGGAAPMIAAGVLQDVTRIYGLHIWAGLPAGTVGTRAGAFMSGVGDLHVDVIGRGGHGAMPQECVDPVVVAAEIVTALQTAVSRSLAMTESGVVSVTKIRGGTAHNVIPSAVEMWGTIRSLSEETRERLKLRIREICEGVATAHGAKVAVTLNDGYPPLINDEEAVTKALAAAREVGVGEEQIVTLPPQGGGEDFAYFAQAVPAAFVFLGARNEARGCVYPHHHARFDIDEGVLPTGAALLAELGLTGGL